MAIFFPPPPPFMGGGQPHDNRPLNPDVEAVAVNNPPFTHRARTPQAAVIVRITQPDPWTYSFAGARQVFTPRKLAPALTDVAVNDPPFALRSGSPRTPQGNIVVSMAQPNPWVYAFQGRQQPFEPRKATPNLIAVPSDDPPFSHFGRAGYTAEIIALAQPNPWSGTFTGGRHAYGQRKLPPRELGVALDTPPFQHWSRTAAHASIIRSWETPPPIFRRDLYDRERLVLIRRVTGRGFILTWGARKAPVNFPPITYGGPVAAKMAAAWRQPFWVYDFPPKRLPGDLADSPFDEPPVGASMARGMEHVWRPTEWPYALGDGAQPYAGKRRLAHPAILFNWGNGSHGSAGSISGTSVTIGVTNPRFSNGTFKVGDLVIAALCLQNGTTDPGAVTAADFTTIHDEWDAAGTTRFWVGWKIAGASEVASYAASWANTANVGWVLLTLSGADQVAPIDVSAYASYAASGTHLVPSITPNLPNDVWLALEARLGANSPDTAQAPLATAYDIQSNSSVRPEISTGYAQLTSAAATGTGSFIQASFTQRSQGVSIGLKTA